MFYFKTPVCRIKRITRFYLKYIDMSNKWVWGVFIIETCLPIFYLQCSIVTVLIWLVFRKNSQFWLTSLKVKKEWMLARSLARMCLACRQNDNVSIIYWINELSSMVWYRAKISSPWGWYFTSNYCMVARFIELYHYVRVHVVAADTGINAAC